MFDPHSCCNRCDGRDDGKRPEGCGPAVRLWPGQGSALLLLGVASGSLAFMRSVSKRTPALTRIGGVGIIGAGAYLIWIA